MRTLTFDSKHRAQWYAGYYFPQFCRHGIWQDYRWSGGSYGYKTSRAAYNHIARSLGKASI